MNKKKKLLLYNWINSGGGSAIDSDVLTYEQRVISAGGALVAGDVEILSTFVTTLKDASIWDKLKDVGVFFGGFAGSVVKLKSPVGIENLLNTAFVSGDYNESKGITSTTAATKKLRTQFIPTDQGLSNTNFSASILILEKFSNSVRFQMADTQASSIGFNIGNNQCAVSGTTLRRLMSIMDVPYMRSLSLTTGFSSLRNWYDNYCANAPAASSPPSVTLNTEIELFGGKNAGSNIFADGTMTFYHIGEYLTESELDTFMTAVRTLMISKGRFTDVAELVGYGDSITYNGNATAFNLRWMYKVAQFFGLREQNLGVSGSRLRDDLSTAVGGYSRRFNYDKYNKSGLLFIAYGANDQRVDTGTGTPAVLADFQTKLEAMIQQAIDDGWPANKIVVISIYYNTEVGANEVRQMAFVAAASAAATTKGTQYVDVWQPMKDGGGAALLAADGLHPIDTGHTLIANTINAAVTP